MSNKHRKYFNTIASEWNSIKTGEKVPFLDYLERFGVAKGDLILDLGAGTGRMTRILAELVGSKGFIVAEDIAEQMLILAKNDIKSSRTAFVCDNATLLAFKTNVFDKVLCFSAFPHIKDKSRAITEIARILHPDGKLLILHTTSSKALNQFHATLNEAVSGDRLPKAISMAETLEKCGFEIICAEESDNLYWVEAKKAGKSISN